MEIGSSSATSFYDITRVDSTMSAERAPSVQAALDAEYEIVRQIGLGGTAIVYLARQRDTGEDVAIKVIRAAYLEDEEALARFAREARFASRLDHPNIVPIRRVVPLGDGGVALVMRHVAGRTLKTLIRDNGRLSAEQASQIFRDVAMGLGSAHAMDIIHRDVKPENIFIDDNGRALLADFGLARSTSGDAGVTMTGVAVGTPSYMPPEQIEAGTLDARGDIYSLGLVAWEMLTGKRPWDGEGLYALLYHQKYDRLPDVREFREDVPDRFAEVIATAIQKSPDGRWQSTAEMIAALDGAVPSHRPFPQPIGSDTVRIPRAEIVSEMPAVVEGRTVVSAKLSAAERLDAVRALESTLEPDPPRRRLRVVAGLLGVAAALILAGWWVHAFNAIRNDEQVASQPIALQAKPAPSSPIAQATIAQASSAPVDSANATTLSLRNGDVAPLRPTVPAPPPQEQHPAIGENKAPPVSPRPAPIARPPAPITAPPAPIVAPTRATIVAGGMHTCLIGTEGGGYCWGANSRGQLGTNSSERASTPTPVGSLADVAELTAGMSHSCAIVRSGAAFCWGDNDRGQLGDGSNDARALPVPLANGHRFRALAAGASHSCGLETDGTAWCWGANARGQLGNGNSKDSNVPIAVVTVGGRYAALALGWDFTCALDAAGHAYCWGANDSGQLGTRDNIDRDKPTLVSSELAFVSIAAGAAHTCAVMANGDTYCWGKNSSGQLGDGTTNSRAFPARVKGGARFTSITAGAAHSCAVDLEHRAQCWGLDSYGQLGDGGDDERQLQPILVAGGHAFSSVRAFGSHTCGATTSGEAFCWGYNLEGQLGDGTRTNRSRPVYLEVPAGRGGQ